MSTEIPNNLEHLKNKPRFTMWVTVKQRKLKNLFRRTEEVKEFVFEPSVLANVSRIAKEAEKLPKELRGNTDQELAMSAISEHLDTLISIVAAGIQNVGEVIDPKLKNLIKRHFTHEQLLEGMQYTVACLGLDSFLHAIVVLKGTTNILKPWDMEVTPGGELDFKEPGNA